MIVSTHCCIGSPDDDTTMDALPVYPQTSVALELSHNVYRRCADDERMVWRDAEDMESFFYFYPKINVQGGERNTTQIDRYPDWHRHNRWGDRS